MEYPFKQVRLESGALLRTFEDTIPESELQWHYDEKDRIIEVLEGSNWKLQLDNELPVTLKEGNYYHIPKYVYHRIFLGNGPLKVLIKE